MYEGLGSIKGTNKECSWGTASATPGLKGQCLFVSHSCEGLAAQQTVTKEQIP